MRIYLRLGRLRWAYFGRHFWRPTAGHWPDYWYLDGLGCSIWYRHKRTKP